MILLGDFLGAKMLLHRQGIIGAALHGGVVGDDDAFLARDPANPGNQSCRRNRAVVKIPCRQGRNLEEGRARVEKRAYPIARQKFAAVEVAFARRGATTLFDDRDLDAKLVD